MTRYRTRAALLVVAAAAFAGLFAAGCGDDDDTTPTPVPTTASTTAATSATTATTAAASPTPDAASKLATIKGDTTGVTDTEIKIGGYIAKTGPAAVYFAVGKATSAYFDDLNKNGGVNGRKINFILEDDGYNPTNTKNVVKKLIEQDRVFMLFNGLGTPGGMAVLPDVKASATPSYFLGSGDARWADQGNLVIGLQPDYLTEGTVLGKFAAQKFKGKKVAIVYQNDDFGKQGRDGVKKGLGTDLQVVDEETYEANAPDWNAQATKAVSQGAEVVFVFSTPTQFASALKNTKAQGKSPVWISSFVGIAAASAKLAEGALDGVYTSAYIKDPSDPDPAIQKWSQWAKDKGLDANDFYTYYGIMAGQTLEQLLKVTGKNLNRASMEYALEKVAFQGQWKSDLLLRPTIVTPTDHKPIEYMWVQQWSESQKKWIYDVSKDITDLETTKR
ncbi:MAG: ABC transporter substrate-binding protein [Dehalococcoidia bacterium]|nr:ABC transporter substrate-binding protein [Dehalococcoidia bacterium]